MDAEQQLDETSATQARSAFLVIWVATVTGALRVAIWAASTITLWHVYGRATVIREHLRIIRVKPQLVVSNGDVLHCLGFYHYLLGIATWLPLGVGLLLLIYCKLLPKRLRGTWQGKAQSVSVVALLCTLALFFLIAAILPMGPALAAAVASVGTALIWAGRIQYGRN